MSNANIMPKGIENVIIALCADYFRRAEIIEKRSAEFNVIMEYRFLNYRMINAAIEVAGPRDAISFIKDIGLENGYATTDVSLLSERAYKTRKTEVRNNIARRLSLM